MENFDARVSRFTSTFPENFPNSYIVGFTIKCKNNDRKLYKEIRVYYKNIREYGQNIPEEKVIDYAWPFVLPQIKQWCKEVVHKDKIKGKQFSFTI